MCCLQNKFKPVTLWPSVVVFCYGLLVWWPSDWRWPSGMALVGWRPPHQKATTPEGHHARRSPHQKAITVAWWRLPPWQLLLQTVRMLLECILVYYKFYGTKIRSRWWYVWTRFSFKPKKNRNSPFRYSSFLTIVKFLYCTFYKSTNAILFIDTSTTFDTRVFDDNCK